MKEIFAKIAEIEKKAESIALSADKAKKDFDETLSESKKTVDAEYKEKFRTAVENKTVEETKNADAVIKKIQDDAEAKISEMNRIFDENEENWENEIFLSIIG